MKVPDNKPLLLSDLECGRDGDEEVTRANQIVDSDPPEVGYLLITATRADRSMGVNSRLAPIP
jgi:hypothetical protein